MASMKSQYGAKKGKKVFYASANKGTIKGVEKASKHNWDDQAVAYRGPGAFLKTEKLDKLMKPSYHGEA